MHLAAYSYVASVIPPRPGAVLEIGAYDVNGSVRELFTGATDYHGIDIREGSGVDEAIDCAAYDGKRAFDTCVSTETLEHMPEPGELIACAWRSLRSGGLLIITAAGPYRVHHGIDGGAVGAGEHYANITYDVLAGMLSGWRNIEIIENTIAHDIYATARRP